MAGTFILAVSTQVSEQPVVVVISGFPWPAVATLLSVIVALVVALFKPAWDRRLHRPALAFEFRTDEPHSHLTFFVGERVDANRVRHRIRVPVYYFRIFVENNGPARAEDVELVVFAVYQHAQRGWSRLPSFPLMSLRWANLGKSVLDGLSPRMMKHCDFFHVKATSNAAELFVETEAYPTNQTNVLGPGRYLFGLRLAAANFAPSERWYEVSFPGHWHDSDMQRLQISVSEGSDPTP